MIELLTLLVAGLCDRVRGGFWPGRPKWLKYLAMACIGPCMVIPLTAEWPLVAMSTLAGFVMWRTDNGWRGKWTHVSEGRWYYDKNDTETGMHYRVNFTWQDMAGDVGVWAAAAAVVWVFFAICMAMLGLTWQTPVLVAGGLLVGTPIAMLISMKLPGTGFLHLYHAHPWSELIGLPVAGLVAYLGSKLI